MAKDSLKEVIKTVHDGEDADQAYARLYGHQMRPCTFRRVFAAIQSKNETTEVDAETLVKIRSYVDEKMNVDEAFSSHCPDFVSPGQFSVAFEKELKARKKPVPQSAPVASTKPAPSKKPVQVPEENPSA